MTTDTATTTPLAAAGRVPGRRGGGGRGARHSWQQLAPGVHGWIHPVGEWGLSNAVLICGDGESALIDTQWDQPMTRLMLEAAPEHPPIETLIYTHPDGDHIWGGRELGALREVLGSDALLTHFHEERPRRLALLAKVAALPARTPVLRGPGPLALVGRQQLLTRYVDTLLGGWSFGAVRAVPPNATFTGATERTIGGRALRLFEAGPIHSSSDSWAHLPDDGIVIAGDLLFIGVLPVMWVGSCEAWVEALDAMLGLEPGLVVPGHGPIGTVADLRVMRDHFSWLGERVAAGHARGEPAVQITERAIDDAQAAGHPWGSWHGPERMLFTVARELRHLGGEPPKNDHSARPKLMGQAAGIADRLARAVADA